MVRFVDKNGGFEKKSKAVTFLLLLIIKKDYAWETFSKKITGENIVIFEIVYRKTPTITYTRGGLNMGWHLCKVKVKISHDIQYILRCAQIMYRFI